ncbi:MAG: hypothetical protein H6739_30530 [Alphaproteobacteria bacterium]|nr:hypothetical protein [Alphaproteobacteria bacterium]
MHVLILLLTGCSPQQAEITGTWHTWLAKNSSATVLERELNLGDATVIDCRQVDESEKSDVSVCSFGTPNPADETYTRPDFVQNQWLDDDVFYLLQNDLDAWRSEAILTSEGDFLLTVHHDLGNGQDFRFAFAIDPNYQPTICIQENQSCYVEGDNDGDGWADAQDPDCVDGSWEVGFTDFGCNDGLDNDGDGAVDAADSDCLHPFADEGAVDASCSDGEDNDGDGYNNNNDPDCQIYGVEDGTTNELFACTNGLDDDGDGAIDSEDSGCANARDNLEDGPTDDNPCGDDADNDGDGWFDNDDPDCDLYDDEAGHYVVACNDGLDNDSDGLTDAEDPGCLVALDALEDDYTDDSCGNGLDDDGDGVLDANDPDCLLGVAEDDTFFGRTECNDGVDNDGDGNIDGSDRQCTDAFDVAEASLGSATCRDTDGADEDGDGWANDEDPDCALGSNEIGLSTLPCNDGEDNDGDSLIDADDPDCLSAWRATEALLDVATDCADLTDNDGDGWADAADAGCLFGDFESDGPTTECGDGVDNDGDGGLDGLGTVIEGEFVPGEPDCHSALDVAELSTNSCLDGADNDGDGWVDNVDPDCASIGYERGFGEGRCSDGVDNDEDGFTDGDDLGCDNPTDPWETETDECTDGLDNDSDGWLDNNDPDCILRDEPTENGSIAVSACNDGSDNDSDGLIDAQDPDCRSALDNIEDTEDAGEPVPYPLDYDSTLDNWASDEDGYHIWYLNAGAYQLNPFDDEDYWVLPQEWLSGYAHSKFAAEEFDVLPNEFFYLGFDAQDPDDEAYAEAVTAFDELAAVWSEELGTYGEMNPGEFPLKVEGNAWRPIDSSEAGLDNWVEVHTSYVRVKDGATFEVGSSLEGDFQIFLVGRDAASKVAIRGSFKVDSLKEDRWGYPVLEDEIREDLEKDGYDVVICE